MARKKREIQHFPIDYTLTRRQTQARLCGKREAEERTIAIRRLGSQEQDVQALDTAIAHIVQDAAAPLAES